jgi:hypothetical protein
LGRFDGHRGSGSGDARAWAATGAAADERGMLARGCPGVKRWQSDPGERSPATGCTGRRTGKLRREYDW